MYKLTISGHSKSKAQLLRRRTKHFIVGQEYEIYFVVKNIGDETSPSGRCFIIIDWPHSKAGSTYDFQVKPLEPNKCDISEKDTLTAHSTGLALISLNKIAPNHPAYHECVERNYIGKDGKSKLDFVNDYDKKKLDTNEAFDFIYATTPEAIYEYWALLIAAIGLSIIALEKVIQALRFLSIIPF